MSADKPFTRETFGEPYGSGPHYMHGDTGQQLEMRRRGQRVRFYDVDTSVQVGEEHANVAPAAGWAYANGYFAPDLAAAGIFTPAVLVQMGITR